MATNQDNIKQGALSSKDLSRGVRIHIPGFRGTFKDAHFEGGVSKEPVSPATQKSLREFFGEGVVKEVKPPKQEKGAAKSGEGEGSGNSDSVNANDGQ